MNILGIVAHPDLELRSDDARVAGDAGCHSLKR
jgi:hypothetical protein